MVSGSLIALLLSDLAIDLILGGFFAVVAVFVFLRNVRTTLISALALPVSVISTFALIRAIDPIKRRP